MSDISSFVEGFDDGSACGRATYTIGFERLTEFFVIDSRAGGFHRFEESTLSVILGRLGGFLAEE